ncbi:uncharacterized protein LOC126370734 [Pectinophora gossypiella]|uniref:uncharacterized protein LOC126370734 n=1 Tax=Pectinophora gossypiella TaxID=13191 RepID=UPI00214E2D68|nr:uncharacterized protein LOC126370734 [Pectinophora gossypiella]
MEAQFQMLFEKMKLEMQSQNAELKDSITNSIMEKMDEKLIPIIKENKKLKTEVEKLEREIEYLKRAEKNNNIVVFGLEENEQSSIELIQKLKETFNLDLNIKIEEYDINKIYRLGNRKSDSNKTRPVLCSFVNNWKKTEIIKNKKNLKNIYITEDYSKDVLGKRKELQAKLIEERQKGNIAYLKYDKLIVKENNHSQEKRKRQTSASPSSDNNQPKKLQTVNTMKTNKANAFDLMRYRSSSLSNIPNTNKNQ